jgi:putative flavoprotein involved in K+ transport
MPGIAFPGEPDRYPTGDEVADYLEDYAAALDVEIRTNTRVVTVRLEDRGFVIETADGVFPHRRGRRGQRIVFESLPPELPR